MAVFVCVHLLKIVCQKICFTQKVGVRPYNFRAVLQLRQGLTLDFSFWVRVKELVEIVRFRGLSWELNHS